MSAVDQAFRERDSAAAEQILEAIRASIAEVRSRPYECRGHYLISDEDLDR